jgi:hypothetical protein
LKILDTSSEEEKIRSLYRIIALISLSVIIFLIVFAVIVSLTTGENIIGEPLVNLPDKQPFEFPQPEIFPIYAKPVTWLYVASISFWFSFLEVIKERVTRMSHFRLSVFRFISFVVAIVCVYEIFYNFSIWSALMSYQATTGDINPDILVNANPNPKYPWNIVFATKVFTALTAIGMYSFFFFNRINSAKEKANWKTLADKSNDEGKSV